jgi:hypothetical protein
LSYVKKNKIQLYNMRIESDKINIAFILDKNLKVIDYVANEFEFVTNNDYKQLVNLGSVYNNLEVYIINTLNNSIINLFVN